MEKFKLAIAGLGGITQVMHLPILSKLKDVEITAICDSDYSKAKNLAKKYGIKNAYKDFNLLLKESTEINSVIIAVPTDLHKEFSIAALESGKNVFVEKPIARNYKETKAIVDVAKQREKLLVVGMNNRFRGDTMLQRNYIRSNEIGELFYIKAGWFKSQSSNTKWFLQMDKSGGGVMLDNGIVILDLGLWMYDFPDVKSVSAVNYYHNTKSVEDSNFTLIRFKNGSTLTLEVSWSFLRGSEFFYCNVYGQQGSSMINPLRIFKKHNNELFELTPKMSNPTSTSLKGSFEYQLKHYIGAAKGLYKPISTGEEALKRMLIVDAIYKSAKLGKEIVFK